MRRASLPLALVAIVLVGVLLTGRLPVHGVRAQDATPSADLLPPGVNAHLLAFGFAPSLPAPADLVLMRFTLQPGAVLPSDPNDPSLGLVYVESGSVTLQLDAPLHITRAAMVAMLATPNAAFSGPEQVAANARGTLNMGDSVVGPPNVGGEVRNTGSGPAVLLLAGIASSETGRLRTGVHDAGQWRSRRVKTRQSRPNATNAARTSSTWTSSATP